MEKINLHIEYDHVWYDHPLTVVTKINDRIINIDVSGQQHILIKKEIKLADSNHILSLKIDGKNEANNEVDDQGNLLKNTVIKLKKLSINDIDVLELASSYQNYASFFIEHQKNQVIKKTTEFGFNGTWELQFKTPFYDWLLESLF